MKVGSIIKTNSKGQIVIPKEIRDALDIDSAATLNIILAGKGMYIYQIEELVTSTEAENSYVKLLERTKGAWKNEKWETIRKKRADIEMKASKIRKKLW